jgi:hypothetical protein
MQLLSLVYWRLVKYPELELLLLEAIDACERGGADSSMTLDFVRALKFLYETPVRVNKNETPGLRV